MKEAFRIKISAALTSACLCFAAAPVDAATYIFDVLYFGGGTASLASGSDNPVGTTLLVGDDFTYSLTGQGGVYSTTTGGGSIFPLMALGVNENGTRTIDYTLTLSYFGNPIFTASEVGISNGLVHLGPNTVTLPGDLVFDRISIYVQILGSDVATSTPGSLLPIFGSPEFNAPGVVSYDAASVVPEPATAAALGLILAGACGLTRHRQRPVSA